MEKNVSKILKN